MAKRFTDNEKWKKTFFKSLSTVNKLFFLYILDECDNAGVWHIEVDIAEIRIGEKIDLKIAKKELGKHIYEFDNGEKWFIPFFIDFQYGVLNPNVNAHKSVIDKLLKRKLTKIYQQFTNCLSSNKNKDKDIDMDKVKNKYGEYSHVLLTDKQYNDLKDKVDNRDKWIKTVDESIEEKGNIYHIKNFYLAIIKWYKKDILKNPQKKTIIGHLYQCPICQEEYKYHKEASHSHPYECKVCDPTEREDKSLRKPILKYIEPIYKE